MKLAIDTTEKTLTRDGETLPLYSREAFEVLSDAWIKVGWDQKYPYTFTWLGRPVVQLPEDMMRLQEVLWQVQPDVVVETGIAHGGSLIFTASLCKAIGKGRVIGVDIEIRPHNRAAVEAHPLSPYITMIEGSSTEPSVVAQVKALIKRDEQVLVVLDSNHTKAHVAAELEAYASLVKPGSFLIATDGIMKDLSDVPRGDPTWTTDHPTAAAAEFAAAHSEFTLGDPPWPFNESDLTRGLTYWPGAWLRRT